MKHFIRSIPASLVLLGFTITWTPANADWVSFTGAETARNVAEIYILDDRVEVNLEVYVGDLETFAALVPDNWISTGETRPPLSERLNSFSSDTLRIVTGTGTQLQARLKLVEARQRIDRQSPYAGMINPITQQAMSEPPKDKRVLYAELVYPFKGKPREITITPPLDDKGLAIVAIGFIAYHKTVAIIDFRYLSAPAKLVLDWQDPWYTKFDNPALKRSHKSAMMSFLYVEPREIRHEMLFRVRDLQDWTDLGLEGSDTIAPDVQARVKDRTRDFLTKRNPLKIDGTLSEPASSRAEFLNIAPTGLQVLEDAKLLDVSTAIIGVILSYPIKRLPQHVSVEWELFNNRIEKIPTTTMDPVGPMPSFVTADDSTIEWQNFLLKYEEPTVLPIVFDDGRSIGVPAVSLALVILCFGAGVLAIRPKLLPRRGWVSLLVLSAVVAVLSIRIAVVEVENPLAGPWDKDTSTQIVMQMLENVNSAFVEINPGALRQALEVIVDGDRLEDIETELVRALAIKVPGGGIARVNTIENLVLKDIAGLPDVSGFRALAEWTARASAGHWGHAHRRTIQFQALMELAEIEGVWKLIGLTVIEAKLQS